MSHCHGDSCSTEKHHHHQSSCGCSCHSHDSCCSENQEDDCCSMAEDFLALADEAWMCLLKEKIKEQIKQSCPNMDELAKIISEANMKKWEHKKDSKMCCGDYEQKLENYFKSCKKK